MSRLPLVSGRQWRGGQLAASTGGGGGTVEVGPDEDGEAYFTALEAATGWSEPADYSDKKTAIDTYIKALKADGNWEKVHAMYLPIWQVAAPNALSLKRTEDGEDVDIYDLTFGGSVTHNGGDYIYGNGSTGYAMSAFRGPAGDPTFFSSVSDTSFSGNVLGGTPTTVDALFGWWVEAAFYPYYSATNARMYNWKSNSYVDVAHSGQNAFWSINTSTPSGVNTNRFDLYKDGSLHSYKESGTTHNYSTSNNLNWLCATWSATGRSHYSKYQVNFFHAGQQMASVGGFNTTTAALLEAI